MESGESPMTLTRGYAATTSLQTALGAPKDVPAGVPQTVFAKGLTAAPQLVCDYHKEEDRDLQDVRQINASEQKGIRPTTFKVGDHVLLQKGGDEFSRRHQKLRGRGEGPWRIAKTVGTAVNLEDPWTGRVLMDSLTGMPDPINMNRLVHFHFVPEEFAFGDPEVLLETITPGAMVAFLNEEAIFLGEVRNVTKNEVVTLLPYEVTESERHGGWSRRPWVPAGEQETQVLWDDLIAIVTIGTDSCLDARSLRRLQKLGADI